MPKNAAPFSTNLAAGIAAVIAATGIVTSTPSAYASDAVLQVAEGARTLYIMLLDEAPLATYAGGTAGIAAAPRTSAAGRSPKLDARAPQSQAYVSYLTSRQNRFLSSAGAALGRPLQPTFQYAYALNGFALELSVSEAAALQRMPDVSSVQPSRMLQLATDSGPAWIGAPSIWQGTSTGGVAGTHGEGVVVGVLDTGINFASPSFAAVDADGYHHVNPRGAGNYLGTCATGGINAGRCNDKVIGAYSFVPAAYVPADSPDVAESAVDYAGHGSHTASTAAGSRATATTADGATATVSGVAPRANVIAYKVCYAPPPNPAPEARSTCLGGAAILAVDRAMADGVDVINFSVGGGDNPWTDGVSSAFRNATNAGIFVAAAAGNAADANGSPPGSVRHLEPWTTTVGASTHDRRYSNAHLAVPGLGRLAGVKGGEAGQTQLTAPISGTLATSTEPTACSGFAPRPSTPNFIAVIGRGTCNFSVKIENARAAGAAAVVVYNNTPAAPYEMDVQDTTIPALMILQADGQSLLAYMQGHAGATATADVTTPAMFDHNPGYANVMEDFSNLGPAGGTVAPMDMIKPDIAAPGADILAASFGDANAYAFKSGTSMATPHVAGAAALLHALHTDWTPMEIKSALMLTARSGLRKRDAVTATDPFDRGAGLTDLTRAATTPLVMNETADNMDGADPDRGGDLSALNLPSLSSANCNGACSFTRTFRNPTTTAQSFTASVSAAAGSALSGTAAPATFTIAPGATQSVAFRIDVSTGTAGAWLFGEVALAPASGDHLTMPIAVRQSAPTVVGPRIKVAPESLESSQASGETKTKTLTVSNRGTEPLTWSVGEQPNDLVLSADGGNSVAAAGDVELKVDTGVGNALFGNGPRKPMAFLNQFALAAADIPFTLNRVDVFFPGALISVDGGPSPNSNIVGTKIGERFDVYVYHDDDDDPANGATLLGSVENVKVAVRDAFQSIPIPGGIYVGSPGNVLIVMVARDATGGYPLAADSGPGVRRTWVAMAIAPAGTPELGALRLVRIEDANPPDMPPLNYSGNAKLRGYGRRGAPTCTALADVPWLSSAPASGSTEPNADSAVTVTLDSTGLAAGIYSADVCVNSNDTTYPIVTVPVTMTVTAGGAGNDTIFKDGFDTSMSPMAAQQNARAH